MRSYLRSRYGVLRRLAKIKKKIMVSRRGERDTPPTPTLNSQPSLFSSRAQLGLVTSSLVWPLFLFSELSRDLPHHGVHLGPPTAVTASDKPSHGSITSPPESQAQEIHPCSRYPPDCISVSAIEATHSVQPQAVPGPVAPLQLQLDLESQRGAIGLEWTSPR